AVLGRRERRAGVLPGRGAVSRGCGRCSPGGPRPGRRSHLQGPGGILVRSKQMRRVRMGLFAGIAAAALGTVMWTVPAWGQSAAVAHTGAAGTAVTRGGSKLTNQLAEMRLATAKYATNLNRAKAAGYQVI